MTALSDGIAAEHRRIWNTVWITCRCGWSNTEPPVTDRDVLIAHIATVTERAVRDAIAQQLEKVTDRHVGESARHRDDSRAAQTPEGRWSHMNTAHARRNKAAATYDAARIAREGNAP